MIGIYKITNQINNKCYIGQSRSIERRFNKHKNTAYNSNADEWDYPLYRAMRKYGLDNFSYEVLEECSIEELNKKEQQWIDYYHSNNKNYGYNQTGVSDSKTAHFQKLNQQSLDEIINKLCNTRILSKDIAAEYGVSEATIRDINRGYTWHNDQLNYPLRKKKEYRCEICGAEITNKAHLCVECQHLLQRVADRPSREDLKHMIRTIPFTKIAEQYNVTDNTIRKWCDAVNLPRRVKDIKTYSDEEWEKI